MVASRIDAGNPATGGMGSPACESVDQRGFNRPIDGDGDGIPICDIGAFEFGPDIVGDGPGPVTDLVSFVPLEPTSTSPDTSGCPPNFVGTFSFDATLTNTSDNTLSPVVVDGRRGIVVEVVTLTNGNLLKNADGAPGGVGARLTISELTLGPGEFRDVHFDICLTREAPFTFEVVVIGVVE